VPVFLWRAKEKKKELRIFARALLIAGYTLYRLCCIEFIGALGKYI
jgi:hypothetical protein